MKHFAMKTRRHRESGAALITALLVSIATALLLAASLAVAMTSTSLGWDQVYSQSALQLADAGVNSELQVISLNAGSPVTSKSSQPNLVSGIFSILNGITSQVKGRTGTVTGYTGGSYYVFSSNDAAGTTAWDGATTPFYITSAASVNGVWQTVQVKTAAASVFNVSGIVAATGGTSSSSTNPCNTTAITTAANSSVTITGPAACNGTVSKGSGCSFKSPCAINYNCGQNSTNRFDSTCVASGGQLCSVSPPICYPKTSDCCRSCFGCSAGTSDATAYATCKSNCCNSTGVYQYTNWANSSTINTNNCCQLQGGCGGYQLNNNCFQNANTKPGTYNSDYWWWNNNQQTTAVQTLIFEPGDYYFTQCQLQYNASCEMVVDPCAYASGGTPGQVRFWLYDPNSATDGNPSDYCQLPCTNTCASGTSTPDPGQFRIYDGKDGCSCNFSKPDNIQDWQGNSITSDFNYYCGIYACTNPATTSNSSAGCSSVTTTTTGVTVGFTGCSQKSHGCCNLCGSMLCDKLSFGGCCNANFVQSQTCTKDPCCGGKVLSWSCNGH